MSQPLSHLDQASQPSMVDVGAKPVTRRVATAEAFVACNEALLEAIRSNNVAKGSVLQVAQLAGIQSAKRTDELIPLCHSLPLDQVSVDLSLTETGVAITAEASTSWKTGVEMEALTAASIAALAVIDMGKAIDPTMTIERVRLMKKIGGKHGEWTRDPDEARDKP